MLKSWKIANTLKTTFAFRVPHESLNNACNVSRQSASSEFCMPLGGFTYDALIIRPMAPRCSKKNLCTKIIRNSKCGTRTVGIVLKKHETCLIVLDLQTHKCFFGLTLFHGRPSIAMQNKIVSVQGIQPRSCPINDHQDHENHLQHDSNKATVGNPYVQISYCWTILLIYDLTRICRCSYYLIVYSYPIVSMYALHFCMNLYGHSGNISSSKAPVPNEQSTGHWM